MAKPIPKPSRASPPIQTVPFHRRFGYRFNMIGAALAQHMLLHIQREFGLNLAEYRIMNALAAFASPSIKDIAKNSQLDKAHVTRALADLIKRGLVTQIVDNHDRRLRVVRLTAAGRGILAALTPFQLARQKRLERQLSASELRIFWKVMAALSEEAERMLAEEAQLGVGRRRGTNAAAKSMTTNSSRKAARRD